jgi:hypothetical protein
VFTGVVRFQVIPVNIAATGAYLFANLFKKKLIKKLAFLARFTTIGYSKRNFLKILMKKTLAIKCPQVVFFFVIPYFGLWVFVTVFWDISDVR